MKKCENCLNRIPVMSENGLHYNCGLSEKKALECITGEKDHSAIVKVDKGVEEKADVDLVETVEWFYGRENKE